MDQYTIKRRERIKKRIESTLYIIIIVVIIIRILKVVDQHHYTSAVNYIKEDYKKIMSSECTNIYINGIAWTTCTPNDVK